MSGPERMIGDRYRVGELLGRGGMAEVRKGHDLRLGRTVAIKRLRVDLAADPTFQARFQREAQSAASLNHPSIVAVYDTGQEAAEDGSGVVVPYIVMEYVEGQTLRDVLRDGRRILPERALEITAGVLTALEYSHRAGIVHRDIKPANVMLTPAGDVKVMDFGIARAVADTSSTMTQTAAVIGTAQYLSPEQARGETVDTRSDIYSTGCVLYELLTARPPFVGDSPVSVAYQHVREEPQPPSSLDEDLTPEIDAITLKALAKSREDRYHTSAQMRADIERALAGHDVHAPLAPTATAAFLPPPTATSTDVVGANEEESDRGRRRWPVYLLLGMGTIALFVLAALAGQQLFGDPPAAEVEVPDVREQTQQAATRELRRADLVVGEVSTETSTDVRRGRVISQDPTSGRFVAAGSAVDLVVSAGRQQRRVPDVTDARVAQARTVLEGRGFRVETFARDSTEAEGQVFGTDPAPGSLVPVGSLVQVFYSNGLVEVPRVVGLSEGLARARLGARGFDVQSNPQPTEGEAPGTVIAQSPRPGANVTAGSLVAITVAEEPAPETTPPTTPSPTPTPTPSPTPTPTPTPSGPPSTPPASPPTATVTGSPSTPP